MSPVSSTRPARVEATTTMDALFSSGLDVRAPAAAYVPVRALGHSTSSVIPAAITRCPADSST